MLASFDINAVTSLLQAAGRDIILPRFQRLASGDIERKSTPTDPDDVVTVADREAEAHLSRALTTLVPGTAVVGEEATHANPALLDLVATDSPLWLLDPIDGTRNFVAGKSTFGTMLAYVTGGQTRAAWIHFPALGDTYVAEVGSGAWLNGARMHAPEPTSGLPRGVLHTRYMPAALRRTLFANAEGQFSPALDVRSAAVEYTDILRGERDFAVYYRLLPWDHAAPGLILEEGGGYARHVDGRSYTPRSSDGTIIVGVDPGIVDRVGAWIETGTPEHA